jgi:hypothetical protein
VETVKVPELAPAAMAMLAGAVAAAAPLEIVTCAPPAGAAEGSATVQALDAPPVTVAGLH